MLDVQTLSRINASKNTKSPPSNSDCREAESYPQCDVIDIKVVRYGMRYWAVYVDDELLVVTVYKKGALAVQNALAHS